MCLADQGTNKYILVNLISRTVVPIVLNLFAKSLMLVTPMAIDNEPCYLIIILLNKSRYPMVVSIFLSTMNLLTKPPSPSRQEPPIPEAPAS